MKIRFSARARREAERIHGWWKENRPYARELFIEELAAMLQQIRSQPGLGARYESAGAGVRRVLMRRTRYHVYYAQEGDEVVLVSVWGAERGRGPKLG